jgi:hypothetical protein
MLKLIKNILILSILFGSIPFVLPAASYACSCAPPPSVEEALQRQTAVFSGKVISISESNKFWGSSADPVSVVFEVTGAWKGVTKSEVTVNTAMSSASCGYDFKMNTDIWYMLTGMKTGLKQVFANEPSPFRQPLTILLF